MPAMKTRPNVGAALHMIIRGHAAARSWFIRSNKQSIASSHLAIDAISPQSLAAR
jgi:hypothetical protein